MAYSLLRAGQPGEAIAVLDSAVTQPGVNEMWAAGYAPCGRSC